MALVTDIQEKWSPRRKYKEDQEETTHTLKKSKNNNNGYSTADLLIFLPFELWVKIFSYITPDIAVLDVMGIYFIWDQAIKVMWSRRSDPVGLYFPTNNSIIQSRLTREKLNLTVTSPSMPHGLESIYTSTFPDENLYLEVNLFDLDFTKIKKSFPNLKKLTLAEVSKGRTHVLKECVRVLGETLETLDIYRSYVSVLDLIGFKGAVCLRRVKFELKYLEATEVIPIPALFLFDCSITPYFDQRLLDYKYSSTNFPFLKMIAFNSCRLEYILVGLLAIPSILIFRYTHLVSVRTTEFAEQYDLLVFDVYSSVDLISLKSVVKRVIMCDKKHDLIGSAPYDPVPSIMSKLANITNFHICKTLHPQAIYQMDINQKIWQTDMLQIYFPPTVSNGLQWFRNIELLQILHNVNQDNVKVIHFYSPFSYFNGTSFDGKKVFLTYNQYNIQSVNFETINQANRLSDEELLELALEDGWIQKEQRLSIDHANEKRDINLVKITFSRDDVKPLIARSKQILYFEHELLEKYAHLYIHIDPFFRSYSTN